MPTWRASSRSYSTVFSPIDLHLRPSGLTMLLFALPAALAAALIHATTLPPDWMALLWLALTVGVLWQLLDVALIRLPGSVIRVQISNDHSHINTRDGRHITVAPGRHTLALPGLIILHLEALDAPHWMPRRSRWLLCIHRGTVHDAQALRRLRVFIRFNKMARNHPISET